MVVKGSRWWDPIAGVCLLIAIFLVAYSLELTYWTYDLNRITAIALLGTMSGLLIGQAAFSRKISLLMIFLYGSGFLLWQLVFSLSDDLLWMNRLLEFTDRTIKACQQLIQNVPLEDGILFLIVISILFCFTTIFAGFRLTRFGDPWLPFGILIFTFFTIQFYLPESQRKYILILVFSVISMILLGRINYLKNRAIWLKKKIKEDEGLSASILKMIGTFAIALSLLAIGIPFIGQKIANIPSQNNFIRQRYSTSWRILRNFFFPLRQQAGFGEGSFDEILALGTSRSLNDDVVFSVQSPSDIAYSGRFYWKGRAYENYQNGYWQSTDIEIKATSILEINPYQPQKVEGSPFLFTYAIDNEILFTPPTVTAVDHPAEISYYLIDNDQQDILDITDYELIRSGDEVFVSGSYNHPSLEQLRQTPLDYPAWVKEHYLKLPENLSEDIQNLALEITADKKFAIDKAMAVTSYLRSTYRYRNYVDIPLDEDPIEWFLFKGKYGYCNYFATADVLMLRSLGIPSRLVAGYSQGERIEDESTFLVGKQDSHAWVEVFFSGIGWIILEPTPVQPDMEYSAITQEPQSIDRREQFLLQSPQDDKQHELEKFQKISDKYFSVKESQNKQEFSFQNYLSWFFILIFVVLCILVFIQSFIMREKQNRFPIIIHDTLSARGLKTPDWILNWADYEQLTSPEKIFIKIKLLSRLELNKKTRSEETPREFLDRLFNQIGLDADEQEKFQVDFHREVYGQKHEQEEEKFKGIYQNILKKILKRVGFDLKHNIEFRFKLLKIR